MPGNFIAVATFVPAHLAIGLQNRSVELHFRCLPTRPMILIPTAPPFRGQAAIGRRLQLLRSILQLFRSGFQGIQQVLHCGKKSSEITANTHESR
jgi:hypothetical protein